jgi:hypothetical protein
MAPKPGGRPPVHDRHELVNAMAYWLRAGWTASVSQVWHG